MAHIFVSIASGVQLLEHQPIEVRLLFGNRHESPTFHAGDPPAATAVGMTAAASGVCNGPSAAYPFDTPSAVRRLSLDPVDDRWDNLAWLLCTVAQATATFSEVFRGTPSPPITPTFEANS